MTTISVLVVDDHTVVRSGLKALLAPNRTSPSSPMPLPARKRLLPRQSILPTLC